MEKDLAKDSDSKYENSILKKLDEKVGGLLLEASKEEDFNGKSGQSLVLRVPGLSFKRLGLFGLGTSSSYRAYRGIGEAIAAIAKSVQASNAAIVLASSVIEELKLLAASAFVSGMLLILISNNIMMLVNWYLKECYIVETACSQISFFIMHDVF